MAHRVSDHFDGKRFHNPGGIRPPSLIAFLRWQLSAQREPWPFWIPNRPHLPPPQRAERSELFYTCINHSSVLLQADGSNLLTDPMWSERASPFTWIGPKRHRAPGIAFEDLPPVDAVLISHNHYDHLDEGTVRRLLHRDSPHFVVPLGLAAILKRWGAKRVTELDWWSVEQAGDIGITSVPAQHFSARTLCDINATLWCGYTLETAAGKVYFAGDTGFGPHFAEIRRRCGAIRLAFLPVGAFLPRWFMAPVHMSPDDAIQAHRILGVQRSVAIHFGTFRLGDDGPSRSPGDLMEACARERISFEVPEFGETMRLTKGEQEGS